MTAGRSEIVWAGVAAHAAGRGGRVAVADVCAVAAALARLSGSWVAAARNGAPDFVMFVTDPVSERLAELQLTFGEGPCHDVLESAAPMLVADLSDAESSSRWSAFAPDARALGAAAVFAFPLAVGAIRAGSDGLVPPLSSVIC
jgi:hypothetical protein